MTHSAIVVITNFELRSQSLKTVGNSNKSNPLLRFRLIHSVIKLKRNCRQIWLGSWYLDSCVFYSVIIVVNILFITFLSQKLFEGILEIRKHSVLSWKLNDFNFELFTKLKCLKMMKIINTVFYVRTVNTEN